MKGTMRLPFQAIILFLPFLCVVQAGEEYFTFEHQGVERGYRLYQPQLRDPGRAAALLVVLHGLRGSGQRVADLTSFDDRAGRHGFIVVYPDSLGSHWNYLHGVPGAFEGPDDPGFLHSLVDRLTESHNIDPRRRYVTGISNGGFMAQRMACEEESRFVGFASVAAGAYGVLPDHCERRDVVDALYLHGTADHMVPWKGKSVQTKDGENQVVSLSLGDSLKFWAERNRCAEGIDLKEIAPSGRSAETRVRVMTSRDCAEDARVGLYAIIGGGHNWPGVEGRIADAVTGRVNLDIHASDVIWSFFETPATP